MHSPEYTLCIIKPNAFNHANEINTMIKKSGLLIIISKPIQLTKTQAEQFYEEHRGKPFFEGLTQFMSEGPIHVQVLKGENAVQKYRDLMGATDSAEAKEGTIRSRFGDKEKITRNAVHGSDCNVSAEKEIKFFFDVPKSTDLFTLKNEFAIIPKVS